MDVMENLEIWWELNTPVEEQAEAQSRRPQVMSDCDQHQRLQYQLARFGASLGGLSQAPASSLQITVSLLQREAGGASETRLQPLHPASAASPAAQWKPVRFGSLLQCRGTAARSRSRPGEALPKGPSVWSGCLSISTKSTNNHAVAFFLFHFACLDGLCEFL